MDINTDEVKARVKELDKKLDVEMDSLLVRWVKHPATGWIALGVVVALLAFGGAAVLPFAC
jgi:hypothetical protein